MNKDENSKTNINNFKNIPNENLFKNYKGGIASIPMKYHPFIDYTGAYKKKIKFLQITLGLEIKKICILKIDVIY